MILEIANLYFRYSRRSWWRNDGPWRRGERNAWIYGKAGESRTKFKNISSHASCGMSRAPRFFLRDGIFSPFLLLLSFLFFLSLFFPSLRITFANHIYTLGELKYKMGRKNCEWFPWYVSFPPYILLARNFHASRNKISRFPLRRVRVNFLLLDARWITFTFFLSLPLFSILNRFNNKTRKIWSNKIFLVFNTFDN